MAKKPKKAPAAEGEVADAAPKGKKKLVIVAAVAVLVLGGGVGAFLKMRGGGHAEAAAGAHGDGHGGDAQAAHGGQGDGRKAIVFVDLREMILNLSPEAPQDKAKLAKIRVALELKDHRAEAEVKPLMPRVEDALQVYMRELRASDLSGSIGLYRLREELLRRVNIAVYPAKVEAVLFKDLIVQ